MQYCWEKAEGRTGNNAASRESQKEDVVSADKCRLPKHEELCMASVQFFVLGWCKWNSNVSCFCILCVYIAFGILRLCICLKANRSDTWILFQEDSDSLFSLYPLTYLYPEGRWQMIWVIEYEDSHSNVICTSDFFNVLIVKRNSVKHICLLILA